MSEPTAARRVAYEVLRRVFEHEAYADRTLRAAARRARLEGRERALAQRLAFGAVQRRGTTDRIAGKLARRPVSRIDPPLIAALRLGLFELLYDEGAKPHAVVDQAVALAKGAEGSRTRGAGLVNAVLRRAAERREELLGSLRDDDVKTAAAMHSIPRWIAELWWRERGPEGARALMAAANDPPRRTFRALGVRRPAPEVVAALASEGVEAAAPGDRLPVPASLFEVEAGPWAPVERLIEAGEILPQSLGSAAVPELLGVGEGDRVLDLCAAPGIKTTRLAELAGPGGEVVAVEKDEGRAAELDRLCERGGFGNVRVLAGDARLLRLGSGYDRVLVDAPCSGLGTVASRPDLRWRRSPEEIEPLAELQRELLETGAGALRRGGSLVYSVCTISEVEGAGVAAAIGDRTDLIPRTLDQAHPELACERDPRFLQILPSRDRTDGFFIAAYEREQGS